MISATLALVRRAAVGVVTLSATAALAADDGALAVGPLVVGMGLDEARAAAPSFAWRDGEISQYSGKLLSLYADAAVTLGGLAHDVKLMPGYYGRWFASFRHAEPVEDAARCERLTVPVVAELEERYGRFSARPELVSTGESSPMQWESRRLDDGGIIVVPVPGSGGGDHARGAARPRTHGQALGHDFR